MASLKPAMEKPKQDNEREKHKTRGTEGIIQLVSRIPARSTAQNGPLGRRRKVGK